MTIDAFSATALPSRRLFPRFAILALLLAGTILAAEIDWGSTLYVNRGALEGDMGIDQFLQTGSLTLAVNAGGGNQVLTQSADPNINFTASSGNLTLSNIGNSYGSFFSTGALNPGNNNIIRTGRWAGGTATVTLNNLTPGQEYRVQGLVADARAGLNGRFVHFDGQDMGVFGYGVSGVTWGHSRLAVGSFVADSSSQSFTTQMFNANGTNAGSQLNAIVVHEKSPTAPLYWDANGDTAGFGTAGGTWGADSNWSTDASGTTTPAVTNATTFDTLNLGTASNGLASGTIDVTGNIQGFANLNVGAASGNLTITGSELTLGGNAAIDTPSGSHEIAAPLTGSASNLTKTGAGTLTLSAANTYGGATTISEGIVRLQAPTVTAPADLGGLQVHLDASNVDNSGSNPVDGTQISSWHNAGNAGDFTIAPGGGNPYLNRSGNPMNGNSVVHFWGAASSLVNTTNFGSDTSIFYVARMTGGVNRRLLTGNSNNWLLGYWRNNMNTAYWGNQGDLSGALDYNHHIFGGIADKSGSGIATTYDLDDNPVVTDVRNPGSWSGPNGLALGGSSAAYNEYSDGDIGEVLVFDSALDANELDQVSTYLRSKWQGLLPADSDVTVDAGATLDLNGVNQTVGSLAGAGQVQLNGALLTIGHNPVSTTFSGDIVDGTIAGAGISKIGNGTLTLSGSGSNTYSGTTHHSDGKLALSKTGGAVAIPGDYVMYSQLSPTAWTTADNQFSPTSVISFFGGADGRNARLNLLGTDQQAAGISEASGRGVIQNREAVDSPPASTGPSTLTLSPADGDSYSFNGYLRSSGGIVALIKNGLGTQTLAGNNITYTGDTIVNAGTLELTSTPNFNSSNVTVNGGTLNIIDAPIKSSSILVSGGTLNLVDIPNFNSSITNNSIVGIHASGTDSWVLQPNRTLSGNGTWIKTGAERATFRNTDVNTSGKFEIREGTLRNDSNSSDWSGSTADMAISAGAILDLYADPIVVDELSGAGFVQNGYGNSSGFSGSAQFYETFTVGVAGGSATFSGVIRDNANGTTPAGATAGGGIDLIKEGSGNQTLAGNGINYSGTTTINAGTLTLDNARNFRSPTTVGPNGTLEIDSTVAFGPSSRWNYSSTLSGTGVINKRGTGVFGIPGTNTFDGQLNIFEGRVHNDNVTGNWTGATADVFVDSGAVLDLRANDIFVDSLTGSGEVWNSHSAGGNRDTLIVGVNDGSGTFSGIIRGNDSQGDDNPDAALVDLEKRGTGTQTLTGDNTYGGTTTVRAGTLLINGSHSGAGAITVLAGATLGGSGSLGNAPVTVSGTLSPGNSPSIFGPVASYAFGSGSNYLWELEDATTTAVGGGWDRLDVSGEFEIVDVNNFSIDVVGLFGLHPEELGLTIHKDIESGPFDIVSYGTYNLNGADVDDIIINAGNLDYYGEFRLEDNPLNNTLDLYFTATVPEPGTWAMFALLLIGGIYYSRRKLQQG